MIVVKSSCEVEPSEAPQESVVVRYQDGWPGVAELPYKEADGLFEGVTRRLLASPAAAGFELRYFELEPGGYSSHERHEHVHVVVVLRGRGRVRIEGEMQEVGFGDVVQIAGLDAHQFSNPSAEPFGFLCIVDRERDLPVPIEGDEGGKDAKS